MEFESRKQQNLEERTSEREVAVPEPVKPQAEALTDVSAESRYFTPNEYSSILQGAEALRDARERKKKIEERVGAELETLRFVSSRPNLDGAQEPEQAFGQRVLDEFGKPGEEKRDVPLSRVYKLAEDLGIDREHVEEVIRSRYPTERQKYEDTRDFMAGCRGSGHNYRKVLEVYGKELVRHLSESSPDKEFKFSIKPFVAIYPIYPFRSLSILSRKIVLYEVKSKVKKNILGRARVKKTKSKVAAICYYKGKYSSCPAMDDTSGSFHSYIYDYSAFRTIEDGLSKLNGKFMDFATDTEITALYHANLYEDVLKEFERPKES